MRSGDALFGTLDLSSGGQSSPIRGQCRSPYGRIVHTYVIRQRMKSSLMISPCVSGARNLKKKMLQRLLDLQTVTPFP